MIKSIQELKSKPKIIDLTGPEGNAFVLLGYAEIFCRKTGKDWLQIKEQMTSGDYTNLLAVFEKEFGEFVELYR